MCMIAFRPVEPGKRGSNIPNKVIDTAMTRHPDGFGIAWREFDADGKAALRVEKFGPAQRKAFRAMLKRVDAGPSEYVAHFRFGTHGPNDQAHAHPFEYIDPIEGRVLVFHNGVVSIVTSKQQSDTEVFVESVLAYLPSRWWADPSLVWLVEQATGWSKFTVMTATETAHIRESEGEWDAGIWYSSMHRAWGSYKPKTAYAKDASGTYVAQLDHDVDSWWAENGYVRNPKTGAYDFVGETAHKAKSARASAGILIGGSENALIGRETDSRRQLTSGGHNVSTLMDISYNVDGDYIHGVVCDECKTHGDVYVIDGKAYIDMAHNDPDANDEELALLPARASGLRVVA
jgi:hypothetical protein